jgi:hypothetical protein
MIGRLTDIFNCISEAFVVRRVAVKDVSVLVGAYNSEDSFVVSDTFFG